MRERSPRWDNSRASAVSEPRQPLNAGSPLGRDAQIVWMLHSMAVADAKRRPVATGRRLKITSLASVGGGSSHRIELAADPRVLDAVEEVNDQADRHPHD